MPTMRNIQLSIMRTLTALDGAATEQELAAEIGVYDARTQAAMMQAVDALVRHGCLLREAGKLVVTAQAAVAMQRPARLSLPTARGIAEQLVTDLEQIATVQRVEIAGSIRRGKSVVGDIELVALVDAAQADLMGNADSSAPVMDLVTALRARAETTVKTGPAMTQVLIHEPETGAVQVDLFQTCDPACWGMLLFIRTGSADFVRRALAYWKKVTAGGECRDLRLRLADGTAVDTPEEPDVFTVLSDRAAAVQQPRVPYVKPSKRVPRGT